MATQPKDVRKIPVEIPLSGKLVTAVDPCQLQPGEFQSLKNMRYTDRGISGIKGVTKAVTNAVSTYTHLREGHHFRKAQPVESHILVQGFNAAENAAVILDNTTAIPAVGDFSGTSLYATAASAGKFSDWPDSSAAFCDGTNSLIYGGNEMRTAQFINYIPDGDFTPTTDSPSAWKYDYTTVVNNTLTDVKNIATLHRYTTTATTNIADVLDDSCDDISKWTSADAVNGASTQDNTSHAGKKTFKFTCATASAGNIAGRTIGNTAGVNTYYGTINLYLNTIGTIANEDYCEFIIAGTCRIAFAATGTGYGIYVWVTGAWSEIGSDLATATAWVKWDFKVDFVNKHVSVYKNDTSVATDVDFTDYAQSYTGFRQYGKTTANTLSYVDYIKVGTYFYPVTTNFTRVKIGATRPISGAKFYMGSTVNATASTALIQYWGGTNNVLCTNIVDGTVTSAKTMTKTGTISFNSTVTTAKPSIYQNTMAYWYDFIFAGVDDLLTVSYVTLTAPMQPVVDLWDGSMRTILQFKVFKTTYEDYINCVNKDSWVDGDTSTYVDLIGLTSSQYLFAAFSERQTAFLLHLAGANINSAASLMTVDYWNGSAWTSVGSLQDGSSVGGKSLAQNGIVSWKPPEDNTEFPTTVASEIPLYIYRVHFNVTLTSSTSHIYLFYVAGIPAQKQIHGYKFPSSWQDRPLLCSDQSGDKNSILIGAQKTACVFNGSDSTSLRFGDETDVLAAMPIFTRYTGNFYESLIVLKQTGSWVVDGTNPGDYKQYEISGSYGLVAPRTLQVCDLGYEISPGINKLIMIWLSSDGIVAFDGNTVFRLDRDISNYFDKSKAECVNASYITDSFGWFDPVFHCYHIRFASGSQTTPTTEFAFDVVRQRWFEVVRTSQTIRGAFEVSDVFGNKYVYGVDNSGFMFRLEYGNSWSGTAIDYQFQTGDFFTPDSLTEEVIRKLELWVQQKTGGGSATVTYYGNGNNTGVSLGTMSLVNASARFAKKTFSEGTDMTRNSSHSIKVTYTNGSETAGFIPVRMGWLIEPKGEVWK